MFTISLFLLSKLLYLLYYYLSSIYHTSCRIPSNSPYLFSPLPLSPQFSLATSSSALQSTSPHVRSSFSSCFNHTIYLQRTIVSGDSTASITVQDLDSSNESCGYAGEWDGVSTIVLASTDGAVTPGSTCVGSGFTDLSFNEIFVVSYIYNGIPGKFQATQLPPAEADSFLLGGEQSC